MSRFPRAVAVGAAHHITQRGIDHQRVFFTDGDRRTYLEWLTTYAAEAYTVSVDPSVIPVCPVIQTSITRSAPQPTPPGADPDTAAFYFTTICPTPTPLPTPTATPAPATLIVNLNPPTILSLSAGSVSTGNA